MITLQDLNTRLQQGGYGPNFATEIIKMVQEGPVSIYLCSTVETVEGTVQELEKEYRDIQYYSSNSRSNKLHNPGKYMIKLPTKLYNTNTSPMKHTFRIDTDINKIVDILLLYKIVEWWGTPGTNIKTSFTVDDNHLIAWGYKRFEEIDDFIPGQYMNKRLPDPILSMPSDEAGRALEGVKISVNFHNYFTINVVGDDICLQV